MLRKCPPFRASSACTSKTIASSFCFGTPTLLHVRNGFTTLGARGPNSTTYPVRRTADLDRHGRMGPVPGFLLPERPIASIDEWLATDVGGLGVERAQSIGPQATIDLVQRSGLRGRGGAGFPTGRKWASIAAPPPSAGPRFVVCNAAEGEPATFKDRALMRANPYQLVEGMIIAAFAVGAVEAYICLK